MSDIALRFATVAIVAIALTACGKKDEQQAAASASAATSPSPISVPAAGNVQTGLDKGEEFAVAWDNDEFVECSASMHALLAFVASSGKDITDVTNYSNVLSTIRKIKQYRNVLSEDQYNLLYQQKNSLIPMGDVSAPNRDTNWFANNCQHNVAKFFKLSQEKQVPMR